jgi:hypothetical protein
MGSPPAAGRPEAKKLMCATDSIAECRGSPMPRQLRAPGGDNCEHLALDRGQWRADCRQPALAEICSACVAGTSRHYPQLTGPVGHEALTGSEHERSLDLLPDIWSHMARVLHRGL